MGSDGKSKKRRLSSISEDEGRSKKHRTRDDGERKKVKSNKKEKMKSEKSHKHSKRHSDKGKKSKEKHDRKHHKRDQSSFQELTNDDYFSKNNEFATWLKEERGSFFSDLSSDAARELFQHFVKDWNSQKLESRYYEGIASGPRTRHDWKISHK
ncbi:style cell-cycle inhibitor 1-B [Macadamia integrifolia]|uniref:style cell-cycle inhibitor 1-B n=1 Tax=Macadamia integrifolia TaxID=60698 RepID=UPI001C4EEAEB|nr:style cell-cycle inhibitor 1-B [Macadamia integrifolia]